MAKIALKPILSPRALFFFSLLGLYSLLFFLYRFLFLALFFENWKPEHSEFFFRSLYLGFKFDLRLAAIVTLPFALWLLIPIKWWEQKRWPKKSFFTFRPVLRGMTRFYVSFR